VRQQLAQGDAPAREPQAGESLGLGRRFSSTPAQQRPATRGHEPPATPEHAEAGAARIVGGIDQEPQSRDAVAGDESVCHQRPEGALDRSTGQAGAARDIGRERRAPAREEIPHQLRFARQRHGLVPGREQPRQVLAQHESKRRGTARGAQLRIVRRRRRAQPSPRHDSAQAELLEVVWLVAAHARRQDLRFPRTRR
jgi:hypothetical protein